MKNVRRVNVDLEVWRTDFIQQSARLLSRIYHVMDFWLERQNDIRLAGNFRQAASFSLANNTLFTCLHTDAVVPVAAGGSATTRELFWFVDGTLEDLRQRIQHDLHLFARTHE